MVEIIYNSVHDEQGRIGILRNFCCGVDFKPDGSQALFSILHLKNEPKDYQKIIDCIQEILQLPLDSLTGHYNWHHKDYISHDGTKRPEFILISKRIK